MKYFYDVPVYRLRKADYNSEFSEERDRFFNGPFWDEMSREVAEHSRTQFDRNLNERYGPWVFNEIVAYIRLHFVGTQIRGEYFSSEKLRTRRTRKKVFKFRGHKLAAEENFEPDAKSEEIYSSILRYLEKCRKELPKAREIDSTYLNAIGPYTDWRQFWES